MNLIFTLVLATASGSLLAQNAPAPQATPALPPVVDASPSLIGQGSPAALPAQASPASTLPPLAFPPISAPAATQPVPVAPPVPTLEVAVTPSPIATGDLWDRIRGGFAMPDLQDEFVTNREQWYATRPDYIARMTERSKKYLFHIVEELEARKMPMELALLPFIESAFNPQAVSTAKAAGMWQFIPSTGRDFSLKHNRR